MCWRSLVIVALACAGHQATIRDAFGHSREPDDSTVLECKEAVVDVQLREDRKNKPRFQHHRY
jgi:hypothetical protein